VVIIGVAGLLADNSVRTGEDVFGGGGVGDFVERADVGGGFGGAVRGDDRLFDASSVTVVLIFPFPKPIFFQG
jgi:hypothetical protein